MEIFLHLKNNFQEQLLGTWVDSNQAEGDTKVASASGSVDFAKK